MVWQLLHGSLTPFGVISLRGRFAFSAPYLFGVLFSSFHGLFIWSPILLPAFIGLTLLATDDGRGKAMAVAVAAELYLLSAYAVAFGHGFGQRLFVSSLPIATVGLALFIERMAPRMPRLAAVAGVAAVWWNLSLMVQHSLTTRHSRPAPYATRRRPCFLLRQKTLGPVQCMMWLLLRLIHQ